MSLDDIPWNRTVGCQSPSQPGAEHPAFTKSLPWCIAYSWVQSNGGKKHRYKSLKLHILICSVTISYIYMMYLDNIHTPLPLPSLSSHPFNMPQHTFLLTFFFFLTKAHCFQLELQICTRVWDDLLEHGQPPRGHILESNWISFPSSYQLSQAPHLTVDSLVCILECWRAWYYSGLVKVESCCELKSTVTMSCSEEGILWHSSPSSGSYILCGSFSLGEGFHLELNTQ